ncbi:FAD:protein FMN transferase [Dokdonia sp. Hel_I_53]|uniref:FAD:protein FMN transferase n=1 Tax=Dokdonia sp. Hel_I_53 TaxID=1566287 RepID=UPI00119A98A6|nr:FAD:protein FMN transferase [Dokdonia sp. Hel_I_53]TVZ53005.1 thiamine biosynthesis lipoprotein [Dokdonia sp. Hel_I_53]
MRFYYFLVILIFFSCNQKRTSDEITISGQAFGTFYSVIYFGKGNEAPRIQKGVDSVIYKVNKSMSTYIPASDISKINRGDSTVVVDDMFIDVFTLSRKLYKATSGYFDPTVGTLRNAYGFGDTEAIRIMDSTKLDSLMRYVGWDKVILNEDHTITKRSPEIYFDFNAVAKGYGVDRIAVYLKSKGFENFLIDIGGEIVASGINYNKNKQWIVGVEGIDSNVLNRSAIASVRLANKAMAGSGNYRKNRVDEITGKEYVHTINPLTGSAEKSDVLSATIIANDCATADAWATACMAMGLQRSIEALKNHDVEAYLIYDGGVFKTDNFEVLNP